MARDRYRYFRIEAKQLVEELTAAALSLGETADDEVVRRSLRAAHTLKGAARVVGQAAIAEEAHAFEDLLEPLRTGGEASPGLTDSCLRLLDSVRRHLEALDNPASSPATERTARTGRSGETGSSSSEPPEPAEEPAPATRRTRNLRVVGVEVEELDRLLQGILEISSTSSALSRRMDKFEAKSTELFRELRVKSPIAKASPLLRDLSKLVEDTRLRTREQLEGLDRELEELRRQTVELRLIPVEAVFGDLERAVRDAARETGKEVRLETRGGETRLDAHVLAGLRGALVHLVRNAVAHGIESASARVGAGKPRAGRVSVTVLRRGQLAVVTCCDDGRGLDAEAIRRTAVERGLIARDRATALDLDAAVRLILKGGLSTSREVTKLSGRGVGLDAVRAAVEELRGEVLVSHSEGRGATFELRVPVSLSSLPALAVEVGEVLAALPLDAVRSVVRLGEGDLVHGTDGVRAKIDGEALPFAPLQALLGLDRQARQQSARFDAVVLNRPSGSIALGVDRVRAVEALLLRSLPAGVDASPVVAGAAFSEDGPPCLVLDPEALSEAADTGSRPTRPVVRPSPPPVLVIDDSLTTRMLERSILESAGYKVDLAVSAEDALEKAADRSYGLFIVDVEMPGMNGYEFVALTRADPRFKAIPAILVTSLSSPEDRRRGREAGACAYVVKSEFDQKVMLSLIAELIGEGSTHG